MSQTRIKAKDEDREDGLQKGLKFESGVCDIVLFVYKCDTSSRSPFASLQLSRFIVIFTFLILFMRGVDGHVSVGETMFTECFSMKLNGILQSSGQTVTFLTCSQRLILL